MPLMSQTYQHRLYKLHLNEKHFKNKLGLPMCRHISVTHIVTVIGRHHQCDNGITPSVLIRDDHIETISLLSSRYAYQ